MRRALGLDPPERRIGLSAHDFAQGLGAPEVILARAAKLAGAPTVTSRFVQRIAALAGEPRWKEVIARGERYLDYARALDHPADVKPAKRPEPKPPRDARPNKLSVTAIEDWLRDPYTIYAKFILRLQPLDAVDTPPGARDRGTVIHGAIGDYTAAFAQGSPADPLRELTRLGEKRFKPLADYPEARAFWWPRFERIARWFSQWDHERREVSPRCLPRSGASSRFRPVSARSLCRPSPTASSAAKTAATPSSITRPARRVPRSRCARV